METGSNNIFFKHWGACLICPFPQDVQFEKIRTDRKSEICEVDASLFSQRHTHTHTYQYNANYQLQTRYSQPPDCSSAGIVSVLENTHKPTRPAVEAIMCLWVYFNI